MVLSDSDYEIAYGSADALDYYDAVTVETWVNNKTDKPIYIMYSGVKINGVSYDDSEFFTDFFTIDPQSSATGLTYLDAITSVNDLQTWSGTISFIDSTTYDTIAEYTFDLTYSS